MYWPRSRRTTMSRPTLDQVLAELVAARAALRAALPLLKEFAGSLPPAAPRSRLYHAMALCLEALGEEQADG
jgi:hypothetical protein